MKKLICCLFVVVILSGLFLAGSVNAAADKPIVFKINTMFPATHIASVHNLSYVPEILKKKSGGRMILEVYYSDSLFATRDALKYLRSGVFDMAFDFTTYHPDETPDLVYPCDYPGQMNIKLWKKWFHAPKDSYASIVNPLYEAYGLKVLNYFPQIGTWYIWSKKPIRKLDDMKGFIARRMGYGSVDTLFREGLGLSTVQLAVGELYEGLQRGTVDVICTPYESFHGFKLHEVAKYGFGPPFGNSVCTHVMRMAAYNALPKDLQKILLDSFIEAQDRWCDEYWDLLVDLRSKLEKAGVTFNTMSESDMKRLNEIMKKYTDAFEKKYPSWAPQFRKASEMYSGPPQ